MISKKTRGFLAFYFIFVFFYFISFYFVLFLSEKWTFIGNISSLVHENNSQLELSLEDLHGTLDVGRGIVEMILAENHPAGLGIPWILLTIPRAIVLHRKRKAHEFVLILVFFLVPKITHGIHQLGLGQRVQLEGKSIGLGAVRATCRIRRAPDFVALHTSHKVRSDSRAGDFLHFCATKVRCLSIAEF
jgi:hypothetical protein